MASGSEDEGGSTAGGANGRDAAAPHKSKSTSALPAGGAAQQQRTGGLAAAAKAALRGVEPELFNPEDLLAATGGLGPGGCVLRGGLGGCTWMQGCTATVCLRSTHAARSAC